MTDALLTRESQNSGGELCGSLPLITPAVDIYQNDDEFMLVTEMPGVNESSVEIVFDKGILTIEGKVCRGDFEGYKLSHTEGVIGNYKRVFRLTDEEDIENGDAVMKDGILTLKMPKHERAKARKITVRSE